MCAISPTQLLILIINKGWKLQILLKKEINQPLIKLTVALIWTIDPLLYVRYIGPGTIDLCGSVETPFGCGHWPQTWYAPAK